MTESSLRRSPALEAGAGVKPAAVEHDSLSSHLANERTHLAYVRTAISLISLGITVNRFSLYLKQHDTLPRAPERVDLLGGAAAAGLGMVIYALVLMLVALHRYRAVERAIETDTFHSDRGLVTLLTLSVVTAAAGGILWMFRQ